MSEQGEEQDKTEEATPFKLKKAREKGQVARGMDLGFAAGLIALAAASTFVGQQFASKVADMMRHSFVERMDVSGRPNEALAAIAAVYWHVFQPLIIFGAIVSIVLIFLELLQLRGLNFATDPLKPDFKRLNPAKGLKRLFSLRMVKETLKNIVKFAAYCSAAWLLGAYAISQWGIRLTDARMLVGAIETSGLRLLYIFVGLALVFAAVDQIIVRGEFRKQMRMSRRELKRETKDREGEPRIKQKRKELHQQMRQQSEDLGNIPGSDLVLVNPDHYAVALGYDPKLDTAPRIRVKGRNHTAALIKRKAGLNGVPIIANPPLARALFADSRCGSEIPPEHYRAVAKHYRDLSRMGSQSAGVSSASTE